MVCHWESLSAGGRFFQIKVEEEPQERKKERKKRERERVLRRALLVRNVLFSVRRRVGKI